MDNVLNLFKCMTCGMAPHDNALHSELEVTIWTCIVQTSQTSRHVTLVLMTNSKKSLISYRKLVVILNPHYCDNNVVNRLVISQREAECGVGLSDGL